MSEIITTRARSKHSRHGCLTCKIRRVKCDETLPECLNCVKTGRQCEGPGAAKFAFKQYVPKKQRSVSPKSSSAKSLTPSPSPPLTSFITSDHEARAFDYFVHRAGPDMSGSLDESFWTELLPSLCLYDTTIRNAVLAISTFYEHPTQQRSQMLSHSQIQGIKWYEQSVAGALAPIKSDQNIHRLEHSLLTCMLFLIIEMQNGNAWSAMHLHKQGFHLIALYLKQRRKHRSEAPWMRHLLPMFARATSQIGYRLELPLGHDDTVINLLPTSSEAIASLADARDSSHFISNRALMLARAIKASGCTHPTPEMLIEQQDILEWLNIWEEKMLELKRHSTMTPAMRRLYHALFSVERGLVLFVRQLFAVLHRSNPYDEVIFTEILDHSEAALDLTTARQPGASIPPFMLEPGVIPGICFVGWSCKDAFTLQRATSLMKRAVQLENIDVARGQLDAIAGILRGDPTKYDRSTQNGFAEDLLASLKA
jgi:hypothetical protein